MAQKHVVGRQCITAAQRCGKGQVSTWTFLKMRGLPFGELRHTAGEKKRKPLRIHEISATEFSRDIPAMPGRTVAASGESARWMFVDCWYFLGPFDNPQRANIDKRFPPETVVDLDAVYEGKSGTRVEWEFYQAHEPKIRAPFRSFTADGKRNLEYIIYYAATELNFENECDLWVAIGSDDFSKVWINDQLIRASGKQFRKWRVDEGFRKVHFNKGVNRILYRVENGHGPTEFSLVVGMP